MLQVTSMTPGTHWRRLRNTLKAAQEMQGTKKKQVLSREDSFLRKFSTRNQRLHSQVLQLNDDTDAAGHGGAFHRSSSSPRYFAVQHDGNFMFNWLGVVTLAVLYNLWTCILRQAFREVQQSCSACWITIDVVCDLVYLLDILVQFRTGYLNQGLMVYDSKKLALRYVRSKLLYVDALCLCPLDFIQLYIGLHPMVRFPRFLKVYRTFRFLHMLESRTAYPNLIRVANLTHILFLGAHWFAAFYYMISEAEDFKGKWSYPRPEGEYAFVSRKYLASLFWSTLTLTTIGDLPPPENGKEYVFVIVSYLLGVFVFATIVGQVGNVINNRNASRQEFERLLDGAKVYMQTHNVPGDLQKRVQRWYDYVWSRGRLNGCDINSLGLLPDKLKTELAIHVNLETLKKVVTIFQECQPEFLHDLVLKMKAYIFTPGDLICRRGEVAREMFIIADGVVEIISESGTILKQMGAGDFFGEIGILNLDGGINRRSADVRSVGYAELFVLSRDDVLGALKDHPDAESIIRDYGQRRLREIEAHRQKVKPLKQMGTLAQLPTVHSRPRINMRNTSRCTSPTQPPGSSPAANACSGGKAPDVFTQTRTGPGGKTYTYCYTGDDLDSRLSTSLANDGFFRSFFSSVRQIFHRKVRRQKQEDDLETGSDWNCAWTTCWEDDEAGGHGVARLCCVTGRDVTDDGDCACRSTDSGEQRAPPRATHVLQRLPTGYAPVLSEEEDESNQLAPPQSPGHKSVAMDDPIDSATYKQCLAADAARPPDLSKVAESVVDNQTVVEMNYVVKSAESVPETNPSQTLFPVSSRSDSNIHDGTCCEGDKSVLPDRSRLDHSRGDSSPPKSLKVKLDNELKETNPTLGKCTAAVAASSSPDECSAVRMFQNLTSSFSSAMHSEQEQETPQKMLQCGNPSTTPSDGPTIRVDSASTIQSADSGDLGGQCTTIGDSCCDVSEALMAYRSNDCRFDEGIMSDFLHPDYPGVPASSPYKSVRERNGKEVKPCRCRSHSAPDIFMQERAKTSAQSRLAGVASCLPSAVDAGFLVAPPSARRIDWVQRYSSVHHPITAL
ncbi:hypothetical protein C0Q70_07134 [Pomacea canaliculata]|uniref:Cyclic nucleotide-binding domain-containing protein n=1 Tax=Pomacea canaliculata TaxID=400727 RepID=A0A2T7PE75_POMCA|nr:hypothetical protein C0Q70_07134 [Pomacea canaliculata]